MPPKKKSDHVGFRNGHLFCHHCGKSFDPQTAPPVKFYADLCMLYAKHHADCPKTWQPPKPPENYTAKQRGWWWKEGMNGERGTSSEYMWSVFMHHENGSTILNPIGLYHPHDPDDFRRCVLLLEVVPEWKEKLHLLKDASPVWTKLVENWPLFTELLQEQLRGKKNDLYKLMQEIGC